MRLAFLIGGSIAFAAALNAASPVMGISGMNWPADRIIPQFSTPADTLDGLDLNQANLRKDSKIMYTVLQGIVNRNNPRIFLYAHASEGKNKWPDLLGLNVNEITPDNHLSLAKKYADRSDGLVLYNPEKSIHYANLASTIAGIMNLLPVTPSLKDELEAIGVKLPVIEDLTVLPYTHATEIYDYLYENYWPLCNHRLLMSQPPQSGYVRDLGVAAASAIVWLDPRNCHENTVLCKFLGDMNPGESIITGWFPEERSGIGLTTRFGLSTIPSDFFENATVYGGMNPDIEYPVVPRMPKLENKIYVTLFMSDGDNVQYCEHAMSQLWDKDGRGQIPINWTISPSLIDFGPGLLNHYYKTATPNDFFASGPSGLGYALIYDAHNYVWNATKGDRFIPYASLSQRYLAKSGLRVITIWDEADKEQLKAYANFCPFLYGLTEQDWERHPYRLTASIESGRLPVVPNLPCYANGIDVIFDYWKRDIDKFDGSRPMFLSAQGESWKMGPDNLVALKEKLDKLSPGNIIICRGDHFFNLFNEAHHAPFNLTMLPSMKVKTSASETPADYVADGSMANSRMWVAKSKGQATISFDFGQPYTLCRYVMLNAGRAGLGKELNTRSYSVQTSLDGKKWALADKVDNNGADVNDTDILPVEARYVRFVIEDAGADNIARIADIEIYGSH